MSIVVALTLGCGDGSEDTKPTATKNEGRSEAPKEPLRPSTAAPIDERAKSNAILKRELDEIDQSIEVARKTLNEKQRQALEKLDVERIRLAEDFENLREEAQENGEAARARLSQALSDLREKIAGLGEGGTGDERE
jgi:LPS O-antigen subunit length determinant protein (WzzB/FepE family)